MTSCSSRSMSTHPYCNKHHQSMMSLETTERRRSIFSRLKPTFHREDLPPLPEGACLSSSSPPPALPALSLMSFDLLPPFQRMTSLSNVYDTSWAQAIQTGPLLPTTVMALVTGTQGFQLHHPQPHSILMTSGITSQFPTVPTSWPASPRQQTSIIPQSLFGTNPSRTGKSCQS